MLKQRRLKNSKKKTSKFEREVESNGNTLLAQAIFLFSIGFIINIQKDSLFVMVSPVTTCRPINAKKKPPHSREVPNLTKNLNGQEFMCTDAPALAMM